MRIEAHSDIGYRKENQDSYWVSILDADGTEVGVSVVCDGMGGLDNGALASRLVVESIRDYLLSSTDFDSLSNVIKNASQTIKSMNEESRSGTTCTVLFCKNGKFKVYHIGDSRCYFYKKNTGKVYILTEDHTAIRKYKDTLESLSEEELKKYRKKLTRCLGIKENVELDYISGNYSSGDYFLVCSDGFWHNLRKSDFLENGVELETLATVFKERGETDNITVCELFV